VINYGEATEIFNATLFANGTEIQTQIISLPNRNSTLISFVWNSTDFVYGNYTLTVAVQPVPNETDLTDNNCTASYSIHVGVPGDVSSSTVGVYDKTVNMRDIAYLIFLFNTNPNSSNWNPNTDVNNDGIVNMKDIAIAILNFRQHE
jgi:hypothetical protein